MKWGDRPHGGFTGPYLGADDHGDWFGHPVGTTKQRSGTTYVSPYSAVILVHADGRAALSAFFRSTPNQVHTYVDICTPPTWHGDTVRITDLDLDVVRLEDGTVFLDDEDEFEEHRVAYGYPAEVVRMAREFADCVLAGVRVGTAPYDGSSERWFRVLDSLTCE
ncbi:DUF402 domain-containing protein [Nocardioides sp. KR10-350]|uniref:DUF402 domain-containing protein n=1 Tax=Nocardioides cheoyonin TaxID=3156615 RepID=UPI0032B33763